MADNPDIPTSPFIRSSKLQRSPPPTPQHEQNDSNKNKNMSEDNSVNKNPDESAKKITGDNSDSANNLNPNVVNQNNNIDLVINQLKLNLENKFTPYNEDEKVKLT